MADPPARVGLEGRRVVVTERTERDTDIVPTVTERGRDRWVGGADDRDAVGDCSPTRHQDHLELIAREALNLDVEGIVLIVARGHAPVREHREPSLHGLAVTVLVAVSAVDSDQLPVGRVVERRVTVRRGQVGAGPEGIPNKVPIYVIRARFVVEVQRDRDQLRVRHLEAQHDLVRHALDAVGAADRVERQVDHAVTDRAVGAGQGHVTDVAVHRGREPVECGPDVWDVVADHLGDGG